MTPTTTARITAADMVGQGRLLTLAQAREALAATEPLTPHPFAVGSGARFRLGAVEPGEWNAGMADLPGTAPVNAVVELGPNGRRTELQLTKDAVLEATSLCGIPKLYAMRTPGWLIEPQLNFWYGEGLAGKNFKVLQAGELAQAVTKGSIEPFSNLELLDQALAAVRDAYGDGELYVDRKFEHSLRRTHLRLIIPERTRTMERTGTDADTWSIGVNLVNSLTADQATSLSGYLFRWWCTNGAIDLHNSSGRFSRRGGGTDVFEWARSAVDEVLGGMEHSLDAVQELVDIPVEGEAMDTLRDIFRQYQLPAPQREAVMENMVETGRLNMYEVMNAITAAANRSDASAEQVEALMQIGGDLPRAVAHRCGECRRLLPE